MSAQRLVTAGALSCYQVIVGDMVCLVVDAAGDRDGVGFPWHRLVNLLAHELIEPA